ncbi:MAG: fibronectin type III-like domain-contianing protein [Lewinellaceae bacterium]|nr:fibronectin type III-like domain-contianing protein [Lewinellaceae bacterium]
MSKAQAKVGETVEVSVNVTNTGSVAGEEVVQLYIHDLSADIARPVKELKGFEKSNQSRRKPTVTFKLTEHDPSYWNNELKFKSRSRQVKVFVGGNSRDVKEVEFELVR